MDGSVDIVLCKGGASSSENKSVCISRKVVIYQLHKPCWELRRVLDDFFKDKVTKLCSVVRTYYEDVSMLLGQYGTTMDAEHVPSTRQHIS